MSEVSERVRGRVWMGTIWEDDDKVLCQHLAMRAQYGLISDDDHTEQGQLHWHVLLQFKNAVVRPKTKTGHWERPKSVLDAREYCLSKGPRFDEHGSLNICTRNGDDWRGFIQACKKQSRAELIDGAFSKLYA